MLNLLELKVDGEVERRLRQSAMDILSELKAVAGTAEPEVDIASRRLRLPFRIDHEKRKMTHEY